MKELVYDNLYAAAYALGIGVRLIEIIPGRWDRYIFDDTEGRASAALGQYRTGALIRAQDYANALKQLRRISRMTLAATSTERVESNGNGSING